MDQQQTNKLSAKKKKICIFSLTFAFILLKLFWWWGFFYVCVCAYVLGLRNKKNTQKEAKREFRKRKMNVIQRFSTIHKKKNGLARVEVRDAYSAYTWLAITMPYDLYTNSINEWDKTQFRCPTWRVIRLFKPISAYTCRCSRHTKFVRFFYKYQALASERKLKSIPKEYLVTVSDRKRYMSKVWDSKAPKLNRTQTLYNKYIHLWTF